MDSDLQYFPRSMQSYREWKGWRHFRGEKSIVQKEERPPYDEAIETLRRKNIMYQTEYKEQRETDPELENFPKAMELYKEWKGWRHFRGETVSIKKDQKPSYKDFIGALIRKNIIDTPEYKEQRETDPELENFPRHISKKIYPEWKGWSHFREQIGVGKPSYNKLVETLRRKNITTKGEYEAQRETDPELETFPRYIDKRTYSEWKGWSNLRE